MSKKLPDYTYRPNTGPPPTRACLAILGLYHMAFDPIQIKVDTLLARFLLYRQSVRRECMRVKELSKEIRRLEEEVDEKSPRIFAFDAKCRMMFGIASSRYL